MAFIFCRSLFLLCIQSKKITKGEIQMKIFELSLGTNKHLMIAKNSEDAYERRAEVDHSYDYLPVEVKELEIEGYDIHVEKVKEKKVEEDNVDKNEDITSEEEKPKAKKKSTKK